MRVFAAVAAVLVVDSAWALDNGHDLPGMGWSSWNHFAGGVNETILMQAADVMVDKGLREAGYVYVNLDDGWAVGRNATGFLEYDPHKFPRGIQYIADYIHSKGLKFGIYTARGSRTCMGRPGSDMHEQLDADLWASWGVDYLKEDSCGGTTHGTMWEQYARMRDALNATGYERARAIRCDDGRWLWWWCCCCCGAAAAVVTSSSLWVVWLVGWFCRGGQMVVRFVCMQATDLLFDHASHRRRRRAHEHALLR